MKTLLLTVALAAIGIAGPALAETPRPERAVAVSTAGLDLSTEKGVRTLDLRILHAASAVCGIPSSTDARGRANLRECRDDVQARVASERNRAIAQARGGNAVAIAAND